MTRSWKLAGFIATAALLTACKTTGDDTTPATASDAGGGTSAGSTDTGGGTTGDTGASGGTGTSTDTGSGRIPTLINVNLQNVLNDLSVSLPVNRYSSPVTACNQSPLELAPDNIEANAEIVADNLEEAADDATTEAAEDNLENAADATREAGENAADQVRNGADADGNSAD